jgi:hypothetical protein
LMADTSSNPFHDYIEKGTVAVRDFMADERIVSAEALRALVLKEAGYYRRIRYSSLRYAEYEARIRASFLALEELYPEAVFPPVYFVIGRTTSGGTATPNGMIIAMEVFADTACTTSYGRPSLRLDDLPYIVAHEIIHFLQPDDTTDQSLLKHCIREGSADFIAELTAGTRVQALNGENVYPYGDAHAAELFAEFQGRASSTDLSGWLYSAAPEGRPQNLGYWMGCSIVRAFYERTLDKRKAIREILHTTDHVALLKQAGYQPKN